MHGGGRDGLVMLLGMVLGGAMVAGVYEWRSPANNSEGGDDAESVGGSSALATRPQSQRVGYALRENRNFTHTICAARNKKGDPRNENHHMTSHQVLCPFLETQPYPTYYAVLER